MGYEFKTELEFLPEVKAFLDSDEEYAMFGGWFYMKAPVVGLHAETVSKQVRRLLRADDHKNEKWVTACYYDAKTHDPVYAVDPYRGLFDDDRYYQDQHDRLEELHQLFLKAKKAARKIVWDEAKDLSSLEADRVAFGRKGDEPVFTVKYEVIDHYLKHCSFERDFSGGLGLSAEFGYLQAAYDFDGLVANLAESVDERDLLARRIKMREWAEVVESEGEEIERACAVNAALLAAVEPLDARTVKAVFMEDGDEVEHQIDKDRLVYYAEDRVPFEVWRFAFSPALDEDPDMGAFLGVKYRGKWVYRTDAA